MIISSRDPPRGSHWDGQHGSNFGRLLNLDPKNEEPTELMLMLDRADAQRERVQRRSGQLPQSRRSASFSSRSSRRRPGDRLHERELENKEDMDRRDSVKNLMRSSFRKKAASAIKKMDAAGRLLPAEPDTNPESESQKSKTASRASHRGKAASVLVPSKERALQNEFGNFSDAEESKMEQIDDESRMHGAHGGSNLRESVRRTNLDKEVLHACQQVEQVVNERKVVLPAHLPRGRGKAFSHCT
jgi:hypothetical protein